MRVLVCGDRDWDDQQFIWDVLRGISRPPRESLQMRPGGPLTIISGMARGADTHAAEWAEANVSPPSPYKPRCEALLKFPAKWDEHGKAAGPIRNQQMLDEGKPDVVLAFHDDLENSKGTKDMVKRAKKAGLPVYLVSRP